MTPKKVKHITYAMEHFYEPPIFSEPQAHGDSDSESGDTSMLYGIAGASEVLSPNVIIRRQKKMEKREQRSQEVEEGSVEGSGAAHVGGG